MSDCCDDPEDACHDDYIDWEDDLGPAKEEPDCYACNDGGCPACEPHPKGCDCADCAEAVIDEYEVFDHPDNQPAVAVQFVDEPPF